MTRNWTRVAAGIGIALIVGFVPAVYGLVNLAVKRDVATFPELQAFSRIAFGTETGLGGNDAHVVKWAEPIVFATSGDIATSIDTYIADYFLTLSEITGLTISPREIAGTKENFLIRSIGPEDVEGVIAQETWKPHARRFLRKFAATEVPCVFVSRTKEGRIIRADVFLKHHIGRSQAEFCVQEEIAQALGLPNDSNTIADTVFNDVNGVMHLTELDETLLRLLYLDAIEPGMSRLLTLYRLGSHLRSGAAAGLATGETQVSHGNRQRGNPGIEGGGIASVTSQ